MPFQDGYATLDIQFDLPEGPKHLKFKVMSDTEDDKEILDQLFRRFVTVIYLSHTTCSYVLICSTRSISLHHIVQRNAGSIFITVESGLDALSVSPDKGYTQYL